MCSKEKRYNTASPRYPSVPESSATSFPVRKRLTKSRNALDVHSLSIDNVKYAPPGETSYAAWNSSGNQRNAPERLRGQHTFQRKQNTIFISITSLMIHTHTKTSLALLASDDKTAATEKVVAMTTFAGIKRVENCIPRYHNKTPKRSK